MPQSLILLSHFNTTDHLNLTIYIPRETIQFQMYTRVWSYALVSIIPLLLCALNTHSLNIDIYICFYWICVLGNGGNRAAEKCSQSSFTVAAWRLDYLTIKNEKFSFSNVWCDQWHEYTHESLIYDIRLYVWSTWCIYRRAYNMSEYDYIIHSL